MFLFLLLFFNWVGTTKGGRVEARGNTGRGEERRTSRREERA
jgi:hypothetical protein